MHRTVLLIAVLSFGSLLLGPQQIAAQVPGAADGAVIRPWLVTAVRLHATGSRVDSDSAVALLRRAFTANPHSAQTLELLAFTHAARVERYRLPVTWYDTAVAYAQRAGRHNPGHAQYLLGRLYGLKGEHAFAVGAFERALQYDSTHASARLWLGHRYFDLGQHERGLPLLLQAAQANPQNTMARNLAGYSYLHLAQPDLAELQFRKSLALRTSEFSVGGLLLTRLVQKNYSGAIALTDRYWRADTMSAWTWARLGEAYLFAGNAAEAARLFAGALARDSASTNNYTWRSTALPLAFLYRDTGREDEVPQLVARSYAHADSLMARGQEPWNAYYHYATLALLEGDREGALRWLRAAHAAGMPGPILIETDPLLADLRGDPKFEEIVQRLRSRVVEIRSRLGLRP